MPRARRWGSIAAFSSSIAVSRGFAIRDTAQGRETFARAYQRIADASDTLSGGLSPRSREGDYRERVGSINSFGRFLSDLGDDRCRTRRYAEVNRDD